jgi:hypothetical protein
MYKLTTIARLFKRVRRSPGKAAGTLAGLLFLAAVSGPVKAQVANNYTGITMVQGGSLGVVPGQTVSVHVGPDFQFQADAQPALVKHTISVYAVTERGSGLVYSGESGGMNEQTFTFGRMDLPVAGEPGTGRVQIWIEIKSFVSPTKRLNEIRNLRGTPATFEVIDDVNGKTVFVGTLNGGVWKTSNFPTAELSRGRSIVFTGLE